MLNSAERELTRAAEKLGEAADKSLLLILQKHPGTEGEQLKVALRRVKRAFRQARQEWSNAFSAFGRLFNE